MAEEAPKEVRVDRKNRKIGGIAPELADRCFTCGTCSGGCPASVLAKSGRLIGTDSLSCFRAYAGEVEPHDTL